MVDLADVEWLLSLGPVLRIQQQQRRLFVRQSDGEGVVEESPSSSGRESATRGSETWEALREELDRRKLALVGIHGGEEPHLLNLHGASGAGKAAGGMRRESDPGWVLSRILAGSRNFRREYETYLKTKDQEQPGGSSQTFVSEMEESLVNSFLQTGFVGAFDFLARYCTVAGPFREKSHWVLVRLLEIMSNLEFCRQQNHDGYLALLNHTIPVLQDSEAVSKLVFGCGQLLWEGGLSEDEGNHYNGDGVVVGCREDMKVWLGSFTNKSKVYFFLRLLPSMVSHLGPDLLDERFLDLLLICSQFPLHHMEEISKCAHDCLGKVFFHAPAPQIFGVFESYLSLSLHLYPQATPYNQFAQAVLSAVKRSDFPTDRVMACARMLSSYATRLENEDAPAPAPAPSSSLAASRRASSSSLRKLCFGLVNVCPLPAVNGLLLMYEALYKQHSSGNHTATRRLQRQRAMSAEIATVLNVNGDYFRKPQLAAWYQHLTTNTH